MQKCTRLRQYKMIQNRFFIILGPYFEHRPVFKLLDSEIFDSSYFHDEITIVKDQRIIQKIAILVSVLVK